MFYLCFHMCYTVVNSYYLPPQCLEVVERLHTAHKKGISTIPSEGTVMVLESDGGDVREWLWC
jgi:hypothetical protein